MTQTYQAMSPTRQHVCPVIGCARLISGAVLMCREHWSAVPAGLRDRVLNERTRRPHSAAFRNVLADAIALVNGERTG